MYRCQQLGTGHGQRPVLEVGWRFNVVKRSDIATTRRTRMDPGYRLDRRKAEAAPTIRVCGVSRVQILPGAPALPQFRCIFDDEPKAWAICGLSAGAARHDDGQFGTIVDGTLYLQV
jgi:hypothetical protein